MLLDIGANPDSSAENLVQYARMGAIFAEQVLGIASPRVALLSIGEEKGKGDLRIQQATELLDVSGAALRRQRRGPRPHRSPMPTSSSPMPSPGNVVIKFFEGLSTFIFDLFRAEFQGSIRGRLAYLLLRPGIGRIRDVFDYEKAGGSPLLGVRGPVIITHGSAKRRMIGFGCEVPPRPPGRRVPALIAEALARSAAHRRRAERRITA